jgi:hypothetical protein
MRQGLSLLFRMILHDKDESIIIDISCIVLDIGYCDIGMLHVCTKIEYVTFLFTII